MRFDFLPPQEVATPRLNLQPTLIGRFVDRCQELSLLIDAGGDWSAAFRRLIEEPMHAFSHRERAILRTILMNIFFRGMARNGSIPSAVPSETFGFLDKGMLRDPLSNPRPNGHRGGISDARLAAAMNYLQRRYVDPELNLSDIARQSRLSKWYFDRLLKTTTGMGFRDHLTAIRMTKARELLETSALEVKEVAANVGYKHTSLFSRHFKSYFGVTASRHRRSRQNVSWQQHKITVRNRNQQILVVIGPRVGYTDAISTKL